MPATPISKPPDPGTGETVSASVVQDHNRPGGGAEELEDGQRQRRFRARVATTSQVVFIVLGIVAFAYVAQAVVLPVLVACVLSMMLSPPVRWLSLRGIPTIIAAALVLGVVVVGIGLSAVNLAQPAAEWFERMPERLPQLREKFRAVLRPAARLSAAAESVETLGESEGIVTKAQPVEVKDNRMASTVFTWTGSALVGTGETVALVFLILASGNTFNQKLVQVMPTLSQKKRVLGIAREIQASVSTYLFTVGVINLGFGIVMALIFHVLGMPNAILWGAMAGMVNFIPYFGPVVGVLILGVAGLLSLETVGQGLAPAGAYLLLHLIESNVFTPMVLGRRFTLNPVVIFVVLIFFTWLWGVIGALLAVPLLVTLRVICDHFPRLRTVGAFLAASDSNTKSNLPLSESLPEEISVDRADRGTVL